MNLSFIIFFAIVFLILFLLCSKNTNTKIDTLETIPNSTTQKNVSTLSQTQAIPTLMLFTMKGCGYCTEMMPVFRQVARQLANKNIVVTTFDADKYSDLIRIHKVGGFPTLILCLNNITETDDCIMYDGERTVEDIVRFVNQYL